MRTRAHVLNIFTSFFCRAEKPDRLYMQRVAQARDRTQNKQYTALHACAHSFILCAQTCCIAWQLFVRNVL